MNKKEEALQDLAWMFTLYAWHQPDCDKFDDLPADETDTTERICTCGLDLRKSEWQRKYYRYFDPDSGLTLFAPDEKPQPAKSVFSVREILSRFAGWFSAFRR